MWGLVIAVMLIVMVAVFRTPAVVVASPPASGAEGECLAAQLEPGSAEFAKCVSERSTRTALFPACDQGRVPNAAVVACTRAGKSYLECLSETQRRFCGE